MIAMRDPDKMFKDAVSQAMQRREDIEFIEQSNETQHILAKMNVKKNNILREKQKVFGIKASRFEFRQQVHSFALDNNELDAGYIDEDY